MLYVNKLLLLLLLLLLFNLHPILGVNIQSLDPDPILRNEGMIDKVNLSLQAEMINTNVNHGQGAIHTPGPKDLHCV